MTDNRGKPVVYVDMDGVLVDFDSGIARLTEQELSMYEGRFDEVPGIFARMDPMPGAIEAFTALAGRFDVYILSTASWLNPSAWAHKVEWIHAHFGRGKGSPVRGCHSQSACQPIPDSGGAISLKRNRTRCGRSRTGWCADCARGSQFGRGIARERTATADTVVRLVE